MHAKRRLLSLYALALAIVTLGSLTSSALATRFSINNILVQSSGRLSFISSGATILCDVTLGVSFPSTFAKTVGTTIGTILLSGAGTTIANCPPALVRSVTFLNGGIVRYTGFSGTLPNITDIDYSGSSYRFLVDFAAASIGSCLYSGGLLTTKVTRNTVTGYLLSKIFSTTSPMGVTGGANCPPNGQIRGLMTVLGFPRLTLI
ncbi:hypothetical protein VSS74_11145 [Conexibacter stalactiti]|uniref:Uncharacterized protein n=1 Tax=Conexibacter stalactiti TaxID=1940611 RepID=A0ABU4HNL7_9ACTN|nr:hypothetical protein [Conexibacter stalactiti]MDW5594898.1 hypothetical protein [Conexibacter stalactiti]MEC5035540.1 hypothetical protein [Conexibacter stalactiti]